MIHFNDDLGLFGRFPAMDMSERDPQALRESYDAFKVVVDRFPKESTPPRGCATSSTRYRIAHRLDHYYRRGACVAAINRAQLAIKDKGAPAIEDALHIMILSYGKLNQPELAEDTKRVLAGTFRQPVRHGHSPRREEVVVAVLMSTVRHAARTKPGHRAGFYWRRIQAAPVQSRDDRRTHRHVFAERCSSKKSGRPRSRGSA